jgi:hypothetical protein
MKSKFLSLFILFVIISLSLCGDTFADRKVRMYVNRGTSILPLIRIGDSLVVKENSLAINAALRGHVYCYLDTVRYSYVYNTNMPVGSMASIDFYEDDTVSIKICFESLTADSLKIGVGNNFPDHLDFRIFKYSDFSLSDSTAYSTANLSFIYRGQSPNAGLYPTTTDSSNFYIRRNGFMHSVFYDIAGLDTGIYEILPTLDIFDVSEQEYGYRVKEYIQVDTPIRTYTDSVESRETEPIYVRQVAGIIDTLNIYMDKAYHFALQSDADSAEYYMYIASRRYRGSVDACKMMALIYGWLRFDTISTQYWDRMEDYKENHADWYRERFRTINGWCY